MTMTRVVLMSGLFLCIPTMSRADDALSNAASPSAAGVVVHVDGSSAANVERLVGDEYALVCQAPCDRRLSARVVYRIAGDDIAPSKPFELPLGAPRVAIHVEERSRSRGALGVLAIVGGSLLVLGSGPLFFVAAFAQSAPAALGGVASLAGGFSLGAWGIHAVSTADTAVTIHPGAFP